MTPNLNKTKLKIIFICASSWLEKNPPQGKCWRIRISALDTCLNSGITYGSTNNKETLCFTTSLNSSGITNQCCKHYKLILGHRKHHCFNLFHFIKLFNFMHHNGWISNGCIKLTLYNPLNCCSQVELSHQSMGNLPSLQ